MNRTHLNETIRDFVAQNRVINPINVTFTEKQSMNGFTIDNVVSERNFRHFKNKLNTNL